MRYQHDKKPKKSLALLLILALLAGILPMGNNAPVSEAAGYGVGAPRTDSAGTVTWDCVWFGNYWQEDTNEDGTADKDDAKQPIKWRVLSVDGDDAFLVADQNLDVQKYNDTYTDVTWETCTMRSWLNGYGTASNQEGKDYTDNNFMDNAFTPGEQAAIKTTTVVNEDSPDYGTKGGNDTQDKVYLLSIGEVKEPAYGFSSDRTKYDKGRRAKNTDYAKAQGAYTNTFEEYAGNGVWWLRSPGIISYYASGVNHYGDVITVGNSVYYNYNAVRPALHLNLSSDSGWSYAGTVSSDGGEIGQATPVPASPIPVSPLPTTPALASPTPLTPTPVVTPPVSSGNTGAGQNVGTSGSGGASSSAGGSTLSAGNGDSANKVSAPAKVSLTSVKSKKKTFTVVWKKVSGANGYEIQYALNKKFTKGKKKKLAQKTKLTVKKLKKKQYFVRVRAYVLQDGKKVYGAWSKVKKVKLKK